MELVLSIIAVIAVYVNFKLAKRVIINKLFKDLNINEIQFLKRYGKVHGDYYEVYKQIIKNKK